MGFRIRIRIGKALRGIARGLGKVARVAAPIALGVATGGTGAAALMLAKKGVQGALGSAVRNFVPRVSGGPIVMPGGAGLAGAARRFAARLPRRAKARKRRGGPRQMSALQRRYFGGGRRRRRAA